MKKLILSLVFALLAFSAFSQDIIIKRTGEEIKGRVVEVAQHFVRFTLQEIPEAGILMISRDEIFMIRYESGRTEVFTLPPQTVHQQQDVPIVPEAVRLGGPRIGFTVIGPGEMSERMHERGYSPFLTQFGWQFETRIFTLSNGVSGLVEFVPLIGGVEQGLFLPSISALVGIRGPKGFEIGFGPNLSYPSGAAVVIAAGTSFSIDYVNFPINVAVVPSTNGMRFSLLAGFNYRKN